MVSRIVISSIMQLIFLASFAASAQTPPGSLTAEQLKTLVSGRTWAISFHGDLTNPVLVAYWDFKANGSLCGRFSGSKAKDRCADEGKWSLQGETVCWDFQKIGEGYGYKSVCARVRKVDEKRYELNARDGKLQLVPFYPVK